MPGSYFLNDGGLSIVMFFTHRFLQLLCESEDILLDGTFKCSTIFAQIIYDPFRTPKHGISGSVLFFNEQRTSNISTNVETLKSSRFIFQH